MRAKNDEDVEIRVGKFLKESVSEEFKNLELFFKMFWQIFNELSSEALDKIVPIEVDYDAYDLGINEFNLQRINEEVQVILIILKIKLNLLSTLTDCVQCRRISSF